MHRTSTESSQKTSDLQQRARNPPHDWVKQNERGGERERRKEKKKTLNERRQAQKAMYCMIPFIEMSKICKPMGK